METDADSLELLALNTLLEGNDPVLAVLRRQVMTLMRESVEFTGVGFFAKYKVSHDAPHLRDAPSFTIADVYADVDGLECGIGFTLFVANGQITTLEAFTYDEPWPEGPLKFELRYISGKTRDLSALHATRGWPKDAPAFVGGEDGALNPDEPKLNHE